MCGKVGKNQMILRSCICFHSLCKRAQLPIVLSLKEREFQGRAETLCVSMVCIVGEIFIKDITGSYNSGIWGIKFQGRKVEIEISHADGE